MKVNERRLLDMIGIFIILFFIILYYIAGYSFGGKSLAVIITFIINGFYIIINIICIDKPFSLIKTFWYFNFFFFFIAPFLQFLSGYISWGYYISDSLYLKTNIILFVCYTLSSFISFIIQNNKINIKSIKNEPEMIFSKKYLIMFIILSFLAFIFLLYKISFSGFFVRELNQISVGDNTINSIITNTCRAIPAYALTYSIFYYRNTKERVSMVFIIIESIILLMLNFPASVTRYWIGLVYIGVFLVIFKDKIIGRKFDLVLILVFAIIFPIFQLFKWYTLSELLVEKNNVVQKLLTAYNSPDFDAYSVLSRTISLVSVKGCQYGHQLMGSLFFIIPRAVWNSKPYPTGQFIAMCSNQYFTNISCPIYAEGFIDFGIFGSILYTILLSIALNVLDNLYWYSNNTIKYNSYMYTFLFGILIYLMRGSLLPVVAYSFTFFIFSFFVKGICFRKR